MKKLIIFCFTCIFSIILTNYAYALDDTISTDSAYYWEEVEATSINQYNSNSYESELYYSITKGVYAIACGEYDAAYIDITHTGYDYTYEQVLETYNYVNEVNDYIHSYVYAGGSEMMSVFTTSDYYETGYYIQVYKLVIVEYDVEDSISSSSSIYSDLKYLDINYEDYLTYEHTTIVSIAMMIDAVGGEHLVAYIYDPFNNDYDNQPGLNLFDILSGVESNEDMQFISSSYNFYKLDLDMMDYFEESLIIEVEVNQIINVSSDALNEANDTYYPQHIILEKSSNDDVFELSYYSIDTLKIDVEATYGYKYIASCSYALGFIPYTDERVLLHYITFDAYKNGEKFELDKMITEVQIKYQLDTYESGDIIVDIDNEASEEEIFSNKTYVSTKAIVTETITPCDISINYGASVDSFSDYWTYLFNNNSASFNFNTLVRYDDDTVISNYTDVDFNGNDYCLYFGNVGTEEEPNYSHTVTKESNMVGTVAYYNYTYDIASNIEFVTLTYLEDGVSYTVLVDSTNIDYDTDLPTDAPGETVDPEDPFDWLAVMESVVTWLANNWQWVVGAIVLLIALSLIKYVKGAIDVLVWIFKTIFKIILLPFKIIAYILDLIFKRK